MRDNYWERYQELLNSRKPDIINLKDSIDKTFKVKVN